MNRELQTIVAQLDALTSDKDAQMFVAVETGFDESGLVGTRDAYLRLAQSLLEFVVEAEAGSLEDWHLAGHLCPGSTQINDVFSWRSEVVIDTTALAQTAQQAQEIMQHCRDANS